MKKSLFTVRIDFEDRTFAIEQTEASTPIEALGTVCRQAEALAEHDRAAIEHMLKERVGVVQSANLRGVWLWTPGTGDPKTSDIFGGEIVQTDPAGPIRK